jgi:putative tricarboxylic transport membrane protein
MKVSDKLSGLLALILGAAVVAQTRTFPPMPGQPIGPALFPAVIGAALMAAGAALVITGARRRSGAVDAPALPPPKLLNFTLVVADLLFYALLVDRLGFLITAVLFLIVLFLAFGVRRTRVMPLAVAVTFLIHYGFYTLLRVPLPWGVLERIAW